MSYDVNCPQGQLLVGIDGRTGTAINKINNFWCKQPNQVSDNSYGGNRVAANVGNDGGNEWGFKCPAGTIVKNIIKEGDENPATFTIYCSALQSPTYTSHKVYGGYNYADIPLDATTLDTLSKTTGCNGGASYITGIYGNRGNLFTTLNQRCADVTEARKGLYTDEGKVNCCMGLYNSRNCPAGLTPQSAAADKFMINWCQSHPNDPRCSCIMSEMTCPNKFDSNCIKKNGYRTSDMVKTPCPSVMNCTQFLSLSPGSQALATNVQQNCSTTVNAGITPTSSGIDNYTWLWSSPLLLVFILLFMLIMIISAIYVLLGSDKTIK
jgi:hypothetical protein